jgi:hypothetical protein
MILIYYKTIDKKIDICYIQNQVDIWIRILIPSIRFACISDNIYIYVNSGIRIPILIDPYRERAH